ncbi:hypothetical protein KY290_013206 [Solanum tuberosum]|uniref:Uncharacterized protein n=1 Tax=Solanum tuberosum TaxID=4113 RepID=A0ABQ7VL19_SOLTU|nr:hypothetical protein KY290_013206 [Solanum tuberosum]
MREAGGFRVRGRAASVEACARRTRHVGSIGRGLRASDVALGHRAKRSRPTSGGIGQGLHASDVACAHRAGDVGHHTSQSRRRAWHARIARGFNGQPRSAVDCQHRPSTARNVQPTWAARRPWTARNVHPTWAARRPWTARNVQPTSAAGSPHGPWLARSGQPWTARIGRGLRDDGQPQRFRLTWFVRRNLVREEPLIQTIGHRA